MPTDQSPTQSERDRARILDLEDAIHEAIGTIEFLHGCLSAPEVYVYAHPVMTHQRLEQLRALVPPRQMCVHSRMTPDCPACAERLGRIAERDALEAR